MTDFKWEDNTEEIFNTAVSLAPKPFRETTIRSLSEAIEKRLDGTKLVTEKILLEAIKEVTPKPFYAMGMKKIKPLLKGNI